MTLRTRRIIYLIFIFIFLIAVPVIILYTAGYRYNWQKNKLQKTGILIIKSKPDGAQIFLNDVLQKITTPGRLDNLLPEDYSIKVQKEGFFPWEKTLPVKSRLTTFAEDITLFRQSLPTTLIDGLIDFISLSPDKTKLAFRLRQDSDSEIWLLDLKTQIKDLLNHSVHSEISTLEWSLDSQKIMFSAFGDDEKNEYVVFDNLKKTATAYKNLSDFYFDFAGIESKNIPVEASENFSFKKNSSGLLAVLNKEKNDLKIFDTRSGYLIFETRAEIAAWSDRGNKLLYADGLEIWFYDVYSDQKILLTRYSKKISETGWINDNYILALFDNTIKTIELDERDQRNTTDLVSLEKIKNFEIDPENQKIYFIGSIGKKEGVFELLY